MATRSQPLQDPAPSIADAELLPALRRGEAGALAEVYRRHAPRLLLLGARLAGSRTEAEDLVQDLFVGLPEALGRYEEQGRFAAWLRRLLVRLALMRFRTARRRMEAPLELAGGSAAREPADGLTLTTLLARLPDDQRVVVVLRTIEGYDHSEIAGLLGVRRNTVEVRFHRAMARLRELLEAMT